MISLRMPTADRVRDLLRAHSDSPFSYPDVGATRGEFPSGYTAVRRAAVLGHGEPVFGAAKRALLDWGPFRVPWIRAFPQSAPEKGVLVAVVVRLAGLWWKNISRVIYTVDEPHVCGFAYGTLQLHAETGEELFLVELSPSTGEVTYKIQAFARLRHPLARLASPLARATQRRFVNDSTAAMQSQVETHGAGPA